MFSQWNIRGLQANREELDLLFSNLDPTVICLQETFLKENKTINFKHYSSYHRHASEANSIVHGGSSVLVNQQHHTDKLNFKVTISLFVSSLLLLHPQLQMAPGSYLKPTGPPFLQKLLQLWVKIILTIWKIPSSISLTSLPI